MNKLDKQYQDLLQDILDNGVVKGDRTGTGTISVFGRQIRHNMKDGFPLLTTKKMPFKNIATELIWFLKGDTNIKFLVDNGCNIWNGDAYKNMVTYQREVEEKMRREMPTCDFQPFNPISMEEFVDKIKNEEGFAETWGDLGPIYGKQWRRWDKFIYDNYDRENKSSFKIETEAIEVIDQIANLVNDLRNNPDSRRLIVNAWNVAEIDDMVLPPCHYGFQVYTRELTPKEREDWWFKQLGNSHAEGHPNYDLFPKRAISLMWNQRSVDTFLGLPFNIASYGLLLEILGKEVNMVPDELIGNLGDTHLYSNHIEQAREQIGREYTEDERIAMFLETGMDAVADKDKRTAFFNAIPKRTREGYPLPEVEINDSWKFGSSSPVFADKLKLDMFKLVGYRSHDNIKAPLSN